MAQTASGSRETQADDARRREVGHVHSTGEAGEQRRAEPAAEAVEGRGWPRGSSVERNTLRTQSREGVPSALERDTAGSKARQKQLRFTALLHHVYDVERLRQAYYALKREAAAGNRRRDMEALRRAIGREPPRPVRTAQTGSVPSQACTAGVHREGGRAAAAARSSRAGGQDRPARRGRGAQRHLRSRTLRGFSYGFRPGRGPHDALNALTVAIQTRKVSWVLDADIRSFFDTLRPRLVGEVRRAPGGRPAHRAPHPEVAEGRGAGRRSADTQRGRDGTRRQHQSAAGQHLPALRVRSVDPAVEKEASARTGHRRALRRRLRRWGSSIATRPSSSSWISSSALPQFGLELHPEKTRLIEFGRFAASDRDRRGQGKPRPSTSLDSRTAVRKTRKTGSFVVLRRDDAQTDAGEAAGSEGATAATSAHDPWRAGGVSESGGARALRGTTACPETSQRSTRSAGRVGRLWWRSLRPPQSTTAGSPGSA